LVFIGFVLGWQWAALRLAVGVALVFIVAELAARFVSADWRPAGALSQPPDANRHFLLAWGSAFIRLAVRLIPEYAVLVFALGSRLFVNEKVTESDVNKVNTSSLEHSSRVDNAA
jgi:uncharacterized membrane protein YoaK (UPF0700 family)